MINEEDFAFCTWFLCSPCALDYVVYMVFHGLLWPPFFTPDSSLFLFVLLETDHYFELKRSEPAQGGNTAGKSSRVKQ